MTQFREGEGRPKLAAIYVRKSTEQHGITDDEKSVTRQVDHAKAYAAKKGWIVVPEHVYQDDGISGVEFRKRPGFNRLMAALEPHPAFQVLIMSEESRLGRDQIETLNALKQIIEAEVRIFVYLDDREVILGDATQTAMVQLRGFAAAAEREQASKRTHDALLRKAKSLHVTGGRVYGYTSVDVLGEPDQDGRRKRLYVRREINPEQAAVVRRIFQLYANGLGLTKIAKTLNAEGVAPPRRDARGWAGTAIREILRRELYQGIVVWDRSQKIVRGGTKRQRTRPEDQWQRIEAPHLRIVSEELWQAVQTRREQAAASFPRNRQGGTLLGRPAQVYGDSPYLLTGFTACAVCGGAIGGMTQYHGTGPVERRKRVTFYGCTTRRKRGPCICSNQVVLRQQIVDTVVLDAVGGVLDSRVIEAAIDKAMARLRASQGQHRDRMAQIERERSTVEARLGRLMEALLRGGSLETVVSQIKAEEERKRALTTELERLASAERIRALDASQIKRDLAARVEDVKAVLGRHTPQGRQILRTLLDGKIVMEPVVEDTRRGYRLSGRLNIGRLLQGEVFRVLAPAVASDGSNSLTVVAPTGFNGGWKDRLKFEIDGFALAA